ncbi:MAG: hypothetical protein ACI8PT_003210 [Gammaproteobacteria bacterium]|jgi:hypothetical protein
MLLCAGALLVGVRLSRGAPAVRQGANGSDVFSGMGPLWIRYGPRCRELRHVLTSGFNVTYHARRGTRAPWDGARERVRNVFKEGCSR